VIAQMLAGAPGDAWEERIAAFMGQAQGAYSLTLLTQEAIYAVRDSRGFRPLCLGRLNEKDWVVASETCALATIGAAFEREVRPGEIVWLCGWNFSAQNCLGILPYRPRSIFVELVRRHTAGPPVYYCQFAQYPKGESLWPRKV
jgi:asparagine synthetase B (glutamine-hydrolysing)